MRTRSPTSSLGAARSVRAGLVARGVGSGGRPAGADRSLDSTRRVYVLPSRGHVGAPALDRAPRAPRQRLGLGTAAVLHRFEAFQRGKVELIVPPSARARSLSPASTGSRGPGRPRARPAGHDGGADGCRPVLDDLGFEARRGTRSAAARRRVTIEELEESERLRRRRRGLPLRRHGGRSGGVAAERAGSRTSCERCWASSPAPPRSSCSPACRGG